MISKKVQNWLFRSFPWGREQGQGFPTTRSWEQTGIQGERSPSRNLTRKGTFPSKHIHYTSETDWLSARCLLSSDINFHFHFSSKDFLLHFFFPRLPASGQGRRWLALLLIFTFTFTSKIPISNKDCIRTGKEVISGKEVCSPLILSLGKQQTWPGALLMSLESIYLWLVIIFFSQYHNFILSNIS